MTVQPLKNLSIISVILLVFVLPLTDFYLYYVDIGMLPFWERMLWIMPKNVVSDLSFSLWCFWLGMTMGRKYYTKLVDPLKLGILIFAIILLANSYYSVLCVDRSRLFVNLEAILGIPYDFLVFATSLLRNFIYIVAGIYVYGNDKKLSGNFSEKFGKVCIVLCLLCVCCLDILYFKYKWAYLILSFITLFFKMASFLLIYKWSDSDKMNGWVEKYKRVADFLIYLCPTAILMYFSNYTFTVILYLGVMWLIYKYVGKIKIIYERKN